MNSTTLAPALPRGTPAAARTALRLMQRLQRGSLTVQLPDGTLQHFGSHQGDGPAAAITLTAIARSKLEPCFRTDAGDRLTVTLRSGIFKLEF